MVRTQRLRFEAPPPPAECGPEEFFLGIWWPKGDRLAVEFPDGAPYETLTGPNWVLASSRSPISSEPRSLVHRDGRGGIAFRGYIVDPAVHGWCDSRAILDAWWERAPALPNGAFAVARLDDRSGDLELADDLLGVGSLYYRTFGRAVLFATSPRYLRMPGDVLDAVAWRLRLSASTVVGNDSLVEGIHRVPGGSRVRFAPDGTQRTESWIPKDFLGPATVPADRGALDRLESAFARAVERCCALPGLQAVLPLSSGHDSRRILAALLQLGVPFEALTVRMLDRAGRDLDARYAAELSSRYGFPHRAFDLPDVERFAALDRDRRLVMHGESLLHAWILPLCNGLPSRPSMILDGLAGDILGETGFMVASLVRPDTSHQEIRDRLIKDDFETLFRAPFWPSREIAGARVEEWLRTLPAGPAGEWAFLLTRTRREIAAWSQRLIPAGHVPVYPYLDIDYVRVALEIDALAKLHQSLQGRCLEAFHPELAAVPGNRDVPADLPREGADHEEARDLACLHALEADIPASERLSGLLPWSYRALHWTAYRSVSAATRVRWWRNPLLEMLFVQRSARPAWHPTDGASAS